MKVDLLPFDPETATREEWKRFHAYRRLRHEETDPDDPLVGDAAAEALLKRPDPLSRATRFAVVEQGTVTPQIGKLDFEVIREDAPSYKGNERLAMIDLSVLQPHRRKGIGTALLHKVAELADAQGKATLMGGSDEADGKAFARRLGAQIGLEGLENRLLLSGVDWAMIEAWIAEGPKRSPGSTMHWYENRIDEELIEPYCRFYTEVFNQQPFGEMDLEELVYDPESFRAREGRVAAVGGTWTTAVTTEENGDISGMTETFYLPDRDTILQQGLTGVKDEYRGRGLGKWLKAAMLRRMRKQLPQVTVLSTRNATSNEAMLAINRRLGFTKHKESEAFQITAEALRAHLEGGSVA